MALNNPLSEKQKHLSWRNDATSSNPNKNPLDLLRTQADFKKFWGDYGYDISKNQYEQRPTQINNSDKPETSTNQKQQQHHQ